MTLTLLIHVLAGGVLLPLTAIAYWKWKLRSRRPVRELVRLDAPQAV